MDLPLNASYFYIRIKCDLSTFVPATDQAGSQQALPVTDTFCGSLFSCCIKNGENSSDLDHAEAKPRVLLSFR